MDNPSGNESGPLEPSSHPELDPSKDTVSESSSRDSDSDSGGESSDSSGSCSKEESGSESGSSSSGDSRSVASSEQSGAFKTPVAVLKPTVAQSSPSLLLSHPGNGVVVVDQPASSSVQSTSDGLPSIPVVVASPVVATPGKSLVLPVSAPSPVPVAIQSTPSREIPVRAHPVQNLQSEQIIGNNGAPLAPESAPEVTSALDGPSSVPVVLKEPVIEVDFDQIELASTAVKLVESTPSSSKVKSKLKKMGVSSKAATEQRYLNKVLKVERALVRAEKGKKRKKEAVKKEKGGKQPKGPPKKKKRSRTRVSSSSESYSSDSSSSSSSSTASEAVPVARIAKIPTGRLLQQCALSRMNELNLAKEPDAKLSEITEALRLIDDFELKPSPDMAFSFYHQVPGSGLPHLEKHVVSFQERYGALVRSVVKFHLLLIQKALIEKKGAVNSDANSPMFLLWQFQNDLARAPPTSTYIAPPAVPAAPVATPTVKTPKSKRSHKSKKSSSKTPGKSKKGSRKRVSSPKKKKRKHGRGEKKSKKGGRKRKHNESSSNKAHKLIFAIVFSLFLLQTTFVVLIVVWLIMAHLAPHTPEVGRRSSSTSRNQAGTSSIGHKRSKAGKKEAGLVPKLAADESPVSPASDEKKRGRTAAKSAQRKLSCSSEERSDSPEGSVRVLFEGPPVPQNSPADNHQLPVDPGLAEIGVKVRELMGINGQMAQLSMAAEIYKKFPADKPNAIPVQVDDLYPQFNLVPGAQSEFGIAELKLFEARASRYFHEGALIEHSLDVARIDGRFALVEEKRAQVPQVHELYRALFKQ